MCGLCKAAAVKMKARHYFVIETEAEATILHHLKGFVAIKNSCDEIWNEEAQKLFQKNFYDLSNNEKDKIRRLYPFVTFEIDSLAQEFERNRK